MCRLLHVDHYTLATKEDMEMSKQESAYDIIAYATSDNYETIGDEDDKDPSIEQSSRPQLGTLPTLGYAVLMPVPSSAPAVYSRMETYPTSVDIVSDSTITNDLVAIEAISEKQFDELETGKTDSPPKESPGLRNVPTYLEIKE